MDPRWVRLRSRSAQLATRVVRFARRRWMRLGTWSVLALAALALVVVVVLALLTYSTIELARFERAEVRRATYMYAAGQTLVPGVNVRLADLAGTLARLRYVETRTTPTAPGQFHRTPSAWDVFLRGEEGPDGRTPQRLRLHLRGERIARITQADGAGVGAAVLEPEILTSAGHSPGEDYRPLRLADAPLRLVRAVLAAEDHRFFDHAGLDLRGLFRAAWANVRAGRVTQGGSTITQQLVKNRLLTPKRTYWRKINEAWLASLIEWRYPKERILESYLNEIYLGQRGTLGIRGVGTAARAYFGKEAHQLTLGEAALLAGMIRAPNSYSPALNPQRARERRDVILGRMRELGHIGDADYRAAAAETVRVQAVATPGAPASYFADYVRQELEARLGSDRAHVARVYTTLDLTLQRFAEAAIARGLDRLESRFPRLRRSEPTSRLQAVLVAFEPSTGEIRAFVGGRDYQTSQYNRALLARRQPGSAFKPFVYLAALVPRQDRDPYTAASLVEDSPITLTVDGTPWTPRNYEDRYGGMVSVRQALEQSLNAATIRLAMAVGLPTVIDTARGLGISSPLSPVPAMVLGAFEVTPMELARAYAPFANAGRRPGGGGALRAVLESDGSALEIADGNEAQVISPAEAYLMTSLMQGVMTTGTGAAARGLGVPAVVAGKTGTTNDGRDAWFVGYSPTLLTLVWVGFDSGEPHGLSAAQAALPLWADFMKQALDTYPSPAFTIPAGIVTADIDPTTGMTARESCPVTAREIFLEGTQPPPCTEHAGVSDRVIDWFNRVRDWWKRL